MNDEQTSRNVIDRLLRALAAQLEVSGVSALAHGAVEALVDMSRAETRLIFGQAGGLVHHGADTEALKTLMRVISAVQSGEAPPDAKVRPGDEVRLVGELPDSLAGYDERWLRETVFVVRYVGPDATVDVQPDPADDSIIATVPAAAVRRADDKGTAVRR